MNMTENALNLVRNSGLTVIAAECLRLDAAQGKFGDRWQRWRGYYALMAVMDELDEWIAAAVGVDKEIAEVEFGDILHAVLSLGAHMGYDIEAALCDAIWRNADRARSARR